jgi:hypothetical protein
MPSGTTTPGEWGLPDGQLTNEVLEFLRLPRLDTDHLPPVRYRKQAESLTETYVDLVRSAMNPRPTHA